MASNVLDSILFRDAFGTPAHARGLRRSRADPPATSRSRSRWRGPQARCGVDSRPRRPTRSPRSRNVDTLDFDLLRHETDIVGYPILPLVHQIVEACAATPGGYVHWGATTQDIMDTAVVLQMRAGFDDRCRRHRGPARHPRRPGAALPRHADGRPHPPAARPADHLRLQDRDLARHVRPPCRAARASCGRACWSAEFAGAAGTLASLGDRASTCRRR